jgi:hypothetical protein
MTARPPLSGQNWSTSSFGESPHPSAPELAQLHAHLELCRSTHRHVFALQCLAERASGFIAARVVSTLLLATLLIGALSQVL